MGSKSNSTEKGSKAKSKFGQYSNHSKHYCITLNQYAQYKQNYLSLNSKSNSKSKSKNESNSRSRPSTAPQKNKDKKKNNNNRVENKKNFIGFNGIVNIRTNLINSNKDGGLNNNKKYKIKETNKNNKFNTLFNQGNNFTNNILMNVNNGVNNKFMINTGNNNGNSRTLFEGKDRRITSSRIYLNQNGNKNKNKKQNYGNKIRLSSAVIDNNNQNKRKIK